MCCCPGSTSSKSSTRASPSDCSCQIAWRMCTASRWTPPFAMASPRIRAWWRCRWRPSTGAGGHDRWRFWDAAGQEAQVRVRSHNVANDGDAVRRWAVLGRGIAYKSYFDVAPDLAAGRLVPLCTDWTTEAVPLFLVAPSRRQLTPLVRALRDFMATRLQALQ